MLNQEELEQLLTDLESDRVERKSSGSDRSAIRRNICAFANNLPGHGEPGIIFVGVNNDGTCADLPITDELLSTLSQMRADGNTLPPPTIEVQTHVLSGCEVAVIAVAPSQDPPVRYQGRVWVKVGPTVQQATAEEESRLAERRRAHDLPFDHRPVPEAQLEDLDMDFFRREYLLAAVATDVLGKNDRLLDQQLVSLRFLTQGQPNYGAVIVFGKDPLRWLPGAYVQFLRIDGSKVTDPILDQKDLSGSLTQVLNRLDELLEINISTATDIASGTREVRRPNYPIIALQQLVRNAILHRNYDGTNAPVKVYWFSDRIEITNPGGLYGQVNPDNFGKGATDYRNPLLAEAMRTLGYVQRFGVGIPLAYKELEKNGNPPPEFEFRPTNILVTVRAVQ